MVYYGVEEWYNILKDRESWWAMSEKRLNNTIFLMYLVTENYCKKHNMTTEDFLEFDGEYAILNYVAECPDIFDSLKEDEIVEEVEHYVSQELL